jgi:hypothetical protein
MPAFEVKKEKKCVCTFGLMDKPLSFSFGNILWFGGRCGTSV